MNLFKKKIFNNLLLLSLCILAITSCNRHEEERGAVLAKAYGKYLYADDLKGIIPQGAGARDSLMIAKNTINTWLNDQVLLNQAENNLSEDQRNFEKLVENYRNSLVIYHYEDLLVKQSLDTIITEREIEDFYHENEANFQLKEDIVKFFCVKLPTNSEHLGEIKDILEDKTPSTDSLLKYCNKNQLDFILEDEKWTPFEKVTKVAPLRSYNHEAFLKNNKLASVTEKPLTYLVYFYDFKIKNGVSPLEFEKQRIISMILNSKKEKLLKEMRHNTFEKALNQGDFEIY